MRTLKPLFRQNFLKVAEHSLCQFWLGRALFGGIYVQLIDDGWVPVDVMLVLEDGSRIFKTQYWKSSFHETFMGIKRIQEFV